MIAGRVPPSDLPAQERLLGQCLVVEGDVDRVVALGLTPAHFYGPDGIIFEAILAVHNEPGMHVEAVIVAGHLRRNGRLDQVGGTPRIAVLCEFPDETSRVEAFCRIVIDRYRERQAIAIQQETIARLYVPQGAPTQAMLEELEQKLWLVTHQSRQSSYDLAGNIAGRALGEMADKLRRGESLLGTSTGYPELDKKTTGYHPGDLVIVAARPGQGKTSFICSSLLRVTRAPKDEQELPEAAYLHSLEMPKEQVALGMVCSIAGVEFQKLRLNQLSQTDWRALFAACQTLMQQPILIDDKPAVTPAEIRSNTRKIQREIDLGRIRAKRLRVVAVDYLQLMRGEQGQGREREISSISQDLKNLAKSESVCVVALSQLNRDVEKKGGGPDKAKRPELAHLRECLAADQWVYDTSTGARVAVKDLAMRCLVASLDPSWKIRRRQVQLVWSTGVKPVFKMTTQTGRTLRATGNHPVRTLSGWRKLEELVPGDRIAVPRTVPEPEYPSEAFTDDELSLLGYLISDGTYQKHRSVGYVKADPVLVGDVRRIALERFGITAKDHACHGPAEQIELTMTGQGRRNNTLINWLKKLGIHGQLGPNKEVPSEVLRMSNRALGIFLAALWAGDGSVVPRKSGCWILKFNSSSFVLLEQVMWILTRLGIMAVLGPPEWNTKSKVPLATITIHDVEHIQQFARMVPLQGIKGEKLHRAASLEGRMKLKPGFDRLPIEINTWLTSEKERQGKSWSTLGYRVQGKCIDRAHLMDVAARLSSPALMDLATSDVIWDPVVSVEPDGKSECFDVCVPGLSNFVCQNIIVHNSGAIEQDADAVWFIYRAKYYDEEANDEAEIIVAKNRNGPTGTVLLVFDGKTKTFRAIERGYEEFEDFGDAGDRPLPEYRDWNDPGD